jgi:CheY-like chemotaxis protein
LSTAASQTGGRVRVVKQAEILLVEDNAGDALLIRETLAVESMPINLHVATDGEEGIQMLTSRRFEPDLVIVDLNLPKVSGLSFLEQCGIEAPVVVFSSSRDPEYIRRAYELGVKDFVVKPSDLADYTREVSYIVRRWSLLEVQREPGGEFAQRRFSQGVVRR